MLYTLKAFKFQNVAPLVVDDNNDDSWSRSVIIPDLKATDFEIFLSELWKLDVRIPTQINSINEDSPSGLQCKGDVRGNKAKYDAITRVIDTLYIDFKNIENMETKSSKQLNSLKKERMFHNKERASTCSNTTCSKTMSEANKENLCGMNISVKDIDSPDSKNFGIKKKVGRKPAKQKRTLTVVEPLIKKEIIERKHRAETNYALRRNIKKVKFMDEITSEHSDYLTGDDDDLSSMSSESVEYKPNSAMNESVDDETEDSEDDDISDEEDFGVEEMIESKDDDLHTDEEDLFLIDQLHESNADDVEYLNSEGVLGIKGITKREIQETNVVPETMTMFTVKVCPDGTVEVLNQEDASKSLDPGCETAIALVGPVKGEKPTKTLSISPQDSSTKPDTISNQRKSADDRGNYIGFGRIVQIMEGEKGTDIENLHKKLVKYSSEKIVNPRSLLKAKSNKTSGISQAENDTDDKTTSTESHSSLSKSMNSSATPEQTIPGSRKKALILFCSLCDYQCGGEVKPGGQQSMRHHAASKHPRSRFFVLPSGNPHRDCVQCNLLMLSYEKTIASDPSIGLKGVY